MSVVHRLLLLLLLLLLMLLLLIHRLLAWTGRLPGLLRLWRLRLRRGRSLLALLTLVQRRDGIHGSVPVLLLDEVRRAVSSDVVLVVRWEIHR